jgi:hypothetical protein
MLDCEISLPGVEPYPAAPTPTMSKTRVELQGAVHQPNHRFDVLTKVAQHVASDIPRGLRRWRRKADGARESGVTKTALRYLENPLERFS